MNGNLLLPQTHPCKFNQPQRCCWKMKLEGQTDSATDLKEIFHLLTKFPIPLDVFLQRSRPDKE